MFDLSLGLQQGNVWRHCSDDPNMFCGVNHWDGLPQARYHRMGLHFRKVNAIDVRSQIATGLVMKIGELPPICVKQKAGVVMGGVSKCKKTSISCGAQRVDAWTGHPY